jgi:hypothetical protein
MQYPTNTCCAVVTGGTSDGGVPTLVTAHYIPRSLTNYANFLLDCTGTWANTYGQMFKWLIGTNELLIDCRATYITSPGGHPMFVDNDFPHGVGRPPSPAPEASFIFRRVGAAGSRIVRGRCRIGPLGASLFTDMPRCRFLDNTNVWVTTVIAQLNANITDATKPCIEVLYDRLHKVTTRVDTYSCPSRRGAVWQRAGYPQGVRGPDRS